MGEKEEMLKEIHMYQISQVNPTTNKTSFGIVNIFDEIEPNGYLHSKKDGEHTLISNFGAEEYICTGSCYCEKEDDRRMSTKMIIERSMITTLATVYAYLVFDAAKKYFTRECASQVETEVCPNESIIAEVNDCERLVQTSQGEEEEEEEEVENKGEESDDPKDHFEGKITNDPLPGVKYQGDKQTFVCSGKCLRRHNPSLDRLLQDAIQAFPCDKLTATGEVSVIVYQGEDNIELASKRFLNTVLEPTCVLKSRREVKHHWQGELKDTLVSLCTGKDASDDNPTVTCRPIGMLH